MDLYMRDLWSRLRHDAYLAIVIFAGLLGLVSIFPFALYRWVAGDWVMGALDSLLTLTTLTALYIAWYRGQSRLAGQMLSLLYAAGRHHRGHLPPRYRAVLVLLCSTVQLLRRPAVAQHADHPGLACRYLPLWSVATRNDFSRSAASDHLRLHCADLQPVRLPVCLAYDATTPQPAGVGQPGPSDRSGEPPYPDAGDRNRPGQLQAPWQPVWSAAAGYRSFQDNQRYPWSRRRGPGAGRSGGSGMA